MEMCFLVVVALATAMTVPVVGALLIFSLMIGPPAAARSFTSRPPVAILLSVAIALVTVWAAIAASYLYNWPIGFFVGALGALSYGAGRAWALLLAARFPGQSDGEVLTATADAAIAAERAGFDDVWFAEHHFMSYGVCPSATTLAAFTLGQTTRITAGHRGERPVHRAPGGTRRAGRPPRSLSRPAGSGSASGAAARGWTWKSSAPAWNAMRPASPRASTCYSPR